MKKVIEDLASKNGLTTGYSGTLRILYIKGEKNHEFIQHVKKLYPNLAFQLKAAVDPRTLNQSIYLPTQTVEELKEIPYVAPVPHPG